MYILGRFIHGSVTLNTISLLKEVQLFQARNVFTYGFPVWELIYGH